MPPILLAVFHCSLYREHISSWGGGGLISISAPPRGATGEVMHNIIVFEISIHAPPRGATESSPRNTARRRYFNSRPSARGDLFRLQRDYHGALISIHAPPRGATFLVWQVEGEILISIHAPPRGATPPAQPQIRTACVFQFTPLREGRQVYKSHGFGRTYFNSRPSARGDSPGRGYQLLINISIHAPPRGATTR